MKRVVGIAVVGLVVAVLAGEGLAQGPYGRMGGGPMGPGMMGRGMQGGEAGWQCPMAGGGSGTAAAVTEEQARQAAQEYADKNLSGFTVDRVLPFTTGRGTAYSVELKGPDGQLRTFHVNPWGVVMPFGGPGRRAS